MRPLAALLIVLLVAFGCKSIKKTKLKSAYQAETAMSSEAVDSVFVSAMIQEQIQEQEEVEEQTQHSFVALDSAGLTVFKPVTIITTKKKVSKPQTSTDDSTETRIQSTLQTQSSETSERLKDLDKSSEGQEVVAEIASAIFPTWGKIIGSVLTVLVPMIWAIWKKRKSES